VVGFGQSKAADPIRLWQVSGRTPTPSPRVPWVYDRTHDKARLHGHAGAISAINPFHLAGNQTIGHIIHTRGSHRHRWVDPNRAPKPPFQLNQGTIKGLVPIGPASYAAHQFVLGKIARAVADHALFFAELIIQPEWVIPLVTPARLER